MQSHSKLIPMFALALWSASPAFAAEAGLLLQMKLARGGVEAMQSTIWAPVGSQASVSADGKTTLAVLSSPATPDTVALQFKLTELGSDKSTTIYRTRITVPLGKAVMLRLGKDASTAWSVEFTPRLSDEPAQEAM